VTSRAALIAGLVGLGQIVLLIGYVAATGTQVLSVRHALLPVVWITLSVWLVLTLREEARSFSGSAAAIGVTYFFVLAAISGVIGLSGGATGTVLVWATPGWGPIVVYGGPLLSVVVIPFEVVGYLALSYGIYRAVRVSSNSAAVGLVGLFSCVGCAFSLIAGIVGFVDGTTVAFQPGGIDYELATVV